MSQKNIQLEWFGRGNINDIETLTMQYFVHEKSKEKVKTHLNIYLFNFSYKRSTGTNITLLSH